MKNNEQNNIPCLSIAQMGVLQELGVDTSDATFAWVVDTSGIVAPIYTLKKDVDNYTDINSVVLPAFGLMDYTIFTSSKAEMGRLFIRLWLHIRIGRFFFFLERDFRNKHRRPL